MDRRKFLKAAGAAALMAALPRCSKGELSGDVRILKNENKPGFYIRFYKPFKAVDPEAWRLDVGGLCERPKVFPLDELKELPRMTQVSRLKCVECWSGKAKWGGFAPKTLFDMVGPKARASHLYFRSADDYYEYISIEELLRPRVLFVYEMNGRGLPDEHGAPLRLIVPFLYGYKNVKTITGLEFVSSGGSGYWSKYGYPTDALIKRGSDYALDEDVIRQIEKPGEPDY